MGSLGRFASGLFWGGISVIVMLIVGRFILHILEQHGGPLAGPAATVEAAAIG